MSDRHLQSRAHQRCGHRFRHGPAHILARMQVQRGCQIQSAAACADIGDIANLGLVGQRLRKLPVEHIAGDRHFVLAIGGVDELAPPNRAQAIEAHQSAHAMPAHG